MGTRSKQRQFFPEKQGGRSPIGPTIVPSLLDAMKDGNEYGSIVALQPKDGNLVPELKRAVAELEAVRKRPCVCYVANLVRDVPETSIHAADHLPFSEMVGRIDSSAREVDVFLATPGGSAEQVNLFVEALRPRFDSVDFLVPYKAMSAGTLWALSGDRIWMDSRSFLGPLDPQVPSKDGSYVPAQALLTLLQMIQDQGAKAIAQKQNPPWSLIRLIDQMDQRQLGAAISASKYVVTMAAQYLERHKFKSWVSHSSSGRLVTPDDRRTRAFEVAEELCSHDRWKAHGHAISRDVLTKELRILIHQPESVPALQRAMRRLWALFYYTFDRAPVTKVLLSAGYTFIRSQANVVARHAR